MIPPEILQIAVQVPLVAVFIWFSLQTQKQNGEAAARRDADWRAFLAELRARHEQDLAIVVDRNHAELDRLADQVAFLIEQLQSRP